jgi:predicted RNase H-like HicB family nuclease
MERIVHLQIERLPEGAYLATSKEVQGLVAQGRTITEVIEIARDVARRLIEAQAERQVAVPLDEPGDQFEYPLLVAT